MTMELELEERGFEEIDSSDGCEFAQHDYYI